MAAGADYFPFAWPFVPFDLPNQWPTIAPTVSHASGAGWCRVRITPKQRPTIAREISTYAHSECFMFPHAAAAPRFICKVVTITPYSTYWHAACLPITTLCITGW